MIWLAIVALDKVFWWYQTEEYIWRPKYHHFLSKGTSFLKFWSLIQNVPLTSGFKALCTRLCECACVCVCVCVRVVKCWGNWCSQLLHASSCLIGGPVFFSLAWRHCPVTSSLRVCVCVDCPQVLQTGTLESISDWFFFLGLRTASLSDHTDWGTHVWL